MCIAKSPATYTKPPLDATMARLRILWRTPAPSQPLGMASGRPWGGGRLALPRAARRVPCYTSLSTALARLSARARARCPRPQGPPSATLWREGILPSLAPRGRAIALAAAIALAGNANAQQAINDPIPERIERGDIVLAAVPLARAPRTTDPVRPGATNNAYARLQVLRQIPDGSGRLAFNDTRGILYVTDIDGRTPRVYLDLREENVNFSNAAFPNEAGFMGFAFHPEFAQQGQPGYGKLYTAYSATPGSGVADYLEASSNVQESVLREWTARRPSAATFAGTSRVLLRVGQFAGNHNVGALAFNPTASMGDADYGLLYIGFGDGGSAHDPLDYGQGLAEPLGAILRIDPLGGTDGASYGIPADNPLVTTADAAQEAWAWGLRHPQQFSWDTSDGRMFISDIGQDQIEEVNLGVAGANYGWRLREGMFATGHAVGRRLGPVYARPATDPQPFAYPIAQYDHDEGFAIGGGHVYRGASIPELVGKYVFTEFVRGRVLAFDAEDVRPGDPAAIEEIRLAFDGVERDLVEMSGFPNTYNNTRRVDARLSVDADGELYLLTKGDGRIRRLASNAPDPSQALDFKGTGDFNADGKADVLLRHTNGRWLYYPMNGRRPITAERGSANLPRSLDWRFVGIGDFDANGRDDVLLKHTDGRWAHYAMEGRRRTSGSTVRGLPTDPAWQVQALGDFNGDGADDLLTRHPDGRWHYYPILGRSVVEADAGLADLPRNLNWRLAGTGDFTGDGKHDVLLRHKNGAWHYYPMNGRTIDAEAAGPASLTRNLAWQMAAIADFNGNGRDDILLRHTDGRWYYYPMNGRRITSGRGTANLTRNLAWQLAATGDFNGDTRADTLLRRPDDGRWFLYPMNARRPLTTRGTAQITTDLDWTTP